jgi:FixJ family two-component response regulator
MSGGELAVQLQSTRPDTRVAFMSGYSEFSRGDIGKEFPDAPMVQKPFSPASLIDIVRQALARPLQTSASRTRDELHVR